MVSIVHNFWHNLKSKKSQSILAFLAVIVVVALGIFLAKIIMAEAPEIVVDPSSYTNIDRFTFSVTGDLPAETAKLQYKTGEDAETWYNFTPGMVTAKAVTIPNDEHPNGKYQEGENFFYFRALDISDNIVFEPLTPKIYKYNITPPGKPDALAITPETNQNNLFTISWSPPSNLVGNPSKAKYLYSFSAPDGTNTTMTEEGETSVGPRPFATKLGKNTVWVVAIDEAGNFDYNEAQSADFYANTTAPPVPTNVNIDDISSKDTNEYRMVVSWTAVEPTDPQNFKGYDVYESSLEGGPYTLKASLPGVSSTAYVHTNLTKDSLHYYYVVSTDNTRNASAQSTVVDKFATGKYTQPPGVTKEPEASTRSKKATISWVTDRVATSSVEYGKTESLGMSTGNSISDYVTDHSVTLTNLEPETTYYYKAIFIDSDGNIGQTSKKSFKTISPSLVSNLKITDVTTNAALITWETNALSKGEVRYGVGANYDKAVKEEGERSNRHSVRLEALADGTVYNLQTIQTDEEGNTFYSDDYKVQTLPFPKVVSPKAEAAKEVDTPTITIEYDTNVETSTIIYYALEGQNEKSYIDLTLTKKHSANLANLTPLRPYQLRLTGRDKLNNEAESQKMNVTTLSDTIPPKISKINAKIKVIGTSSDAESQVAVSVSTNEASRIVVEGKRGLGGEDYNIATTPDNLGISHTVSINLGKAGYPYTYRVRAIDETGNESFSEPQTIVIPSPKKGALDFVLDSFSRTFGWLGRYFE